MISLKQFTFEQAQAQRCSPAGIYWRIRRGNYPAIRLVRQNQRVIFVANVAEAAASLAMHGHARKYPQLAGLPRAAYMAAWRRLHHTP